MTKIEIVIPEASVPPPGKPYDRFDVDVKSDDSSQTIAWAVGQALSEWEAMEGAFASCYAQLCQDTTGIAAASYGTVTSSRSRGEMLKQAVQRCPNWLTPCARELKALLEVAGNFAVRRNEIAHGYILGFEVADVRRFYLCPATYSTKHHPTPLSYARAVEEHLAAPEDDKLWIKLGAGEYAYSASQLLYYRDQFFEIGENANRISRECWLATTEARKRGEAPYPPNGMVRSDR